jgi:broad specificity phosphatase PhoE
MQTRLILVRHGDSVHSAQDVIGGPHGCLGLTRRGHDQARALAAHLSARLSGAPGAVVYSSTLRRAIETAQPIAEALATEATADCDLCTWHTPAYADGMPKARFRTEHARADGGVFRPFQEGNETWAQLVARTGRAVLGIAARHRGGTVVLVGHSETVQSAFDVLGGQPLYRPFDLVVAPASLTEWSTGDDPAAFPPARWALHRFGETPG